MAPRVRGLRPRADRQCGFGTVPTRCLRRGHVGAATPLRTSEGVQSRAAWALQTQLVGLSPYRLEAEPDDGIWEVRGPRRHFTHSKVMAWVAVDRAVKTLEEWPDLEGPLEEWRKLRHEIFTEVCEKGYNKEIGAFTQYYGCDQLDASVLMIPLVGFLRPRIPGSSARSRRSRRGWSTTGSSCAIAPPTTGRSTGSPVARAPSSRARSGGRLPAHDRADQGRPRSCSGVCSLSAMISGLLSEEYDAIGGRLVGNLPQAFSQVSLVNSACRLDRSTTLLAVMPEETDPPQACRRPLPCHFSPPCPDHPSGRGRAPPVRRGARHGLRRPHARTNERTARLRSVITPSNEERTIHEGSHRSYR